MARFDVSPNPDGNGYLLDVQSDLLEQLNTRVVVPLMPLGDAPEPAKRLNPVFTIDGTPHVMVTQFLAAVPTAQLPPPVVNVAERSGEVINALDMVFVGF
ncbi:CcdB family protein [Shimia sp. CNT1-13L.2]|uniref:CcdB family protein n=1 Tax=Shimia sp. CNT1-13L.2 TaxID=2959663 RepID=UPI0020CF8F3F|nr:CcdB family protein [Shimia sp. CNT1-13L.2]MCP9481814.1 CcdB family protein [Shimia sp. CNT1-13L.2]